ncbi:hypothetical protein P170DRAFT_421424 [Aspergillus steynii IBT 23096]|uniref:Uncharacterized protein n=1 Tax=Aspergillus steynii IBT 23096 TaxID=1392250 RepID=A0A2I2GPG6_9EURO|nr:uncharacterized protein P170DRAFT_421424 [Aspergillus steynii IBT 23096]PLB54770.1 hypothetical protein P170DRAFT_421424 [Aspergillus steynii IBT 23096]
MAESLQLGPLFEALQVYDPHDEEVTLDGIIWHLQCIEMLDRAEELLGAQRLLIFAVLGWRSMLFLAAFNVCSLGHLSIRQDSCQPQSGHVFDEYIQPAGYVSSLPLAILLKAYGNLIPSGSSSSTQVASEKSKASSSWLPLYPKETNAYLLQTLLRVRIRWVDTLALHLDYDKSSKTLSIFAYPSFCLSTLHAGGLLYSFASIDHGDANPDDISQLLREVLLSYRLLFGQSGPSRKLFRRHLTPSDIPPCEMDPLLPLLCTNAQLPYFSPDMPPDRPIYFAARDFPVYSERIELIRKELRDARPKSLADQVRDKRDTLQYWTFWLVAIFGGLGLVLSLVQVIQQGIQLSMG